MKPERADATLDEIDTSSLSSLEAVRGEEAAVRQLVQKAVEKKESVSAGVFSRVMGDYEERLRAFDQRAEPLREQARREFGKLELVHARLKSALDTAVLAQQEIDFRHELGELQDQEFEERGQKAKLEVANTKSAFDRAEALRLRFFDLLPPAPEPAPPSPSKSAKKEAREATGSNLRPITDTKRKLAGSVPPVAGPKAPVVPTEAAADGSEYGTISIVQPGRLVEEESGAIHPLGLRVTVGRTADNQIPLETPDVSRRHAKIELRADGTFLVTDLRSGNGTFVNGEKIKERALEDGDKVRFGNRSFVFHKQS